MRRQSRWVVNGRAKLYAENYTISGKLDAGPLKRLPRTRKVSVPMLCFQRMAVVCLASVYLLAINSCGIFPTGKLSFAAETTDPLASYSQIGDTDPVLDPSIIRQGSTYYAFSTDVAEYPENGSIPIHCSHDKINWAACGAVFPEGMPAWIQQKVPGVIGLMGSRHLLFQWPVSSLLQRLPAPHAADCHRSRYKYHARSCRSRLQMGRSRHGSPVQAWG